MILESEYLTAVCLEFRWFQILSAQYLDPLSNKVGIWITNIWIGETSEKQTFTCLLFRCPVIVCFSRHDLNTGLKVCYSSHDICSLRLSDCKYYLLVGTNNQILFYFNSILTLFLSESERRCQHLDKQYDAKFKSRGCWKRGRRFSK